MNNIKKISFILTGLICYLCFTIVDVQSADNELSNDDVHKSLQADLADSSKLAKTDNKTDSNSTSVVKAIYDSNSHYYKKIVEDKTTFDKLFMSQPELAEVIKNGSFPTATLYVNTHNGITIFFGFSQGQVAEVIFNDNNLSYIKKVNMLKSDKAWDRAVTSIAYEDKTKIVFAGLGYKKYSTWEWSDPTDPNNQGFLDIEKIKTIDTSVNGGGVMYYHNGEWKEFVENKNNKTSVVKMRPFAMESIEGKKEKEVRYIVIYWGPKQVPQKYHYSVSFDDELPIASDTGGDMADSDFEQAKYYNVELGDNFKLGTDLFPENKGKPGAAVPGKRIRRMYFAGYDDGSVYALDRAVLGGEWKYLAGKGWDKITAMVHSQFGGREYLLTGQHDGALELFKFVKKKDGSGETMTVREVQGQTWGSPIKEFYLSNDEKQVMIVLENNSVQWFDFVSEKVKAEILPPGNNAITVAARPLINKNNISIKNRYTIVVGFKDGAIWQGIKDLTEDNHVWEHMKGNTPVKFILASGNHYNGIDHTESQSPYTNIYKWCPVSLNIVNLIPYGYRIFVGYDFRLISINSITPGGSYQAQEVINLIDRYFYIGGGIDCFNSTTQKWSVVLPNKIIHSSKFIDPNHGVYKVKLKPTFLN